MEYVLANLEGSDFKNFPGTSAPTNFLLLAAAPVWCSQLLNWCRAMRTRHSIFYFLKAFPFKLF